MFEDSESPAKKKSQEINSLSDKTSGESTRLKPKRTALKIIIGLVAAILVAITVYTLAIRNKYRSEIRKVSKEYNLIQNKVTSVKEVKSQRLEFFTQHMFLNHPGLTAYTATNFLRKLSLITPGNMTLLELSLEPFEQSIGFILKGTVNGSSQIKIRQILNRFYQRLTSQDEVIEISSSPPKPAEKNPDCFEFSVKGELEVE